MRHRRSLTFPLLLLTPAFAPAQAAVVGAGSPPTQRIAVHRSAGLAEAGAGVLRGGGAYYDARFDAGRRLFEPALGRAVATTQELSLTPSWVGRDDEPAVALPSSAAPMRAGRTAVFEHGAGVAERFACGVDGVEVSWRFAQRPAGSGDLVVRYAVDTTLPPPVAAAGGGLRFVLTGIGGVSIGGVRGIDAAGDEVEGRLRWHRGALEMSLPARFVDEAAYPLVLDPMIGTEFGIWNGPSYDDSEPDCAYEATEQRYLVAFRRAFSAGDVRVRAQLVNSDGTLQYGVIWISSNGVVAGRPRVASHSLRGRFGIVWTEDIGANTVALFQSVPAAGSPVPNSLPSPLSIGISSQGTVLDLDIGSEKGTPGQPQAFVTVWHDYDDGRIFARRIGYAAAGNAVPSPGFTVFVNSVFAQHSAPALARAADRDGRLMVVVQKYVGLGPQRGIVSALLSASADTVDNVTTIVSSATHEYTRPDVDGYGSQWVVAWTENSLGSAIPRVALRSAAFDGTAVQLGAVQTVGGGIGNQTNHPTVGYSHGKTWVGYRYQGIGQAALSARGVDSASCASCADTFSAPITTNDARIVVATTMSGNQLQPAEGLIVWGESGDVWAQRVANHSGNGTVASQGGGCGSGGNQQAQAPATGMNRVVNSISGLSPTALFTVFNLAAQAVPVVCGPCEWVPFSVIVPMPVSSSGNASIDYVVPCLPTLVGTGFETQWTTFDPGAAPCAVVPGWAVSDRYLHTIGS